MRATHDRAVTVDDPAHAGSAGVGEALRGRLAVRTRARALPGVGVARRWRSRRGRGSRAARRWCVWRRPSSRCMPRRTPVGDHGQAPLALWLVFVCEIDLSRREGACGLGVADQCARNDLRRPGGSRVDWYEARWLVEEFLQGAENGLQHRRHAVGQREPRRKGQASPRRTAWKPAIALLSVVAVQLLCPHQASRDEATADRPATEVFTQEEVAVLSRVAAWLVRADDAACVWPGIGPVGWSSEPQRGRVSRLANVVERLEGLAVDGLRSREPWRAAPRFAFLGEQANR